MKRIAIGVMLGALGIFAWQRAMQPAPAAEVIEPDAYEDGLQPERDSPRAVEKTFKCDGRTRCSQMHSCAEAMYFLENCPGVEMDGEGDGIPCERQWCKHRG
jgi:hypothetical protein